MGLIAERFWQVVTHKCGIQGGYVGLYPVISRFLRHRIDCALQTLERLHQGTCQILLRTPSFVDETAVILPFMNIPDLDRDTCNLSETSSRPIAGRTSHRPTGYTPSGNKAVSYVAISYTTDEGELRICVSMSESDFVDGVFGEGEEILGLGGEHAQRMTFKRTEQTTTSPRRRRLYEVRPRCLQGSIWYHWWRFSKPRKCQGYRTQDVRRTMSNLSS